MTQKKILLQRELDDLQTNNFQDEVGNWLSQILMNLKNLSILLL